MADFSIKSAHNAPEYGSTNLVTLHPLVIVNITDHHTRANLPSEENKKSKTKRRVVGALIGEQLPRKLEIHTSFEVLFKEDSKGVIQIDVDFMKKKKEQYNAVFPSYEVLGWYQTASGLSQSDIVETHKSIVANFIESPLILLMDTQPGPNVKTLPVYIFESVQKIGQNGAIEATYARKIRYTVESEESERIGVDTAMKVDFADEKNPTLVPQAERVGNAVLMLKNRIAVVLTYLKAVKKGEFEAEPELLRQICCLCNQLPCADSPSFTASFQRDYEDAILIAYLGVLTKSTTLLNKLVEKSAVFAERRRPNVHGFDFS